jgi:hypothetical protein
METLEIILAFDKQLLFHSLFKGHCYLEGTDKMFFLISIS